MAGGKRRSRNVAAVCGPFLSLFDTTIVAIVASTVAEVVAANLPPFPPWESLVILNDSTLTVYTVPEKVVRVCDRCLLEINAEKRKDSMFAALRPLISKGTLASMDCFIEFLKPGRDVDAADPENGKTVLMEAAERAIPEIFLPLLHEFNASLVATDNQGKTVLMFAAIGGAPVIVKAILEKQVDVNAKDMQGLTAYDHAKAHKNDDVADLIQRAQSS